MSTHGRVWLGWAVAPLAAIALLGFGASAAQADVSITFPANGVALKTSPNETDHQYQGIASTNSVSYLQFVTFTVFEGTWPVGSGSDNTNIVTGAWAEDDPLGSRLPPFDGNLNPPHLPDGTPLPDGKYTLKVTQSCPSLGCAFDFDDTNPNNAHAQSTFWVDSLPPDTRVDSVAPPGANQGGPKTFTFNGDDPAPRLHDPNHVWDPRRPEGEASGITRFDCRVDGGLWDSCVDTFGVPPDSGGELAFQDPEGTFYVFPPFTFTTPALGEGSHTFSVRAVDRAFNVDPTPATSTWVVDTTPPVATIATPPNRQRYLLHENVPADYSCDDPLSGGVASGIASCVGNVPDGSPIDTSTLGPHLFTVTATDNAGNTSTKTHAYVVDPPRYADRVGEDDPLAYYRLNEPLGSDPMNDSSGNHHDGEYKNGIALQRPAAIACERRPHPPRACELANDPQDWAAFFPARDGYGFVNGITAPQSAYTLEAWIKPANGNDMSIVGHGGGGQLFISGGHLALRQTQDTVTGGGPTLTPGQWWHVGASWDGHTTRLYVNGAQVTSSASANKPPSGTSTFYVGYGDQAPWFHGTLDEVAYYDHALPAGAFSDRYVIGTASDHPSLGYPPDGSLDTAGPSTDPDAPVNGGLYAPGKVPHADFSCDDPDGPADIASCTAFVDGDPIANGAPLPDTPGQHIFTVWAVDKGTPPNTYVHPHGYTVKTFADIYKTDNPVAYFRLGDGDGTMADASGNGHDGEYKNTQESGPIGIAGDGDHARHFYGDSGYGYVNGIAAPRYQSTLEVWVNAASGRDQNVLGHGDAGALFVRGGKYVYRRMGDEVVGSVGPTPGTFQQVAGVWDGVDMTLYVNGVEVGRTESTKRPSSISTFYVGYGEFGPWFDGSLDEVAYYDRALSAARVYQHFLADPPADLSVGGAPVAPPSAGDGGGGDARAGSSPSGDAPSSAGPPAAAPSGQAPGGSASARTTTTKPATTKRSTASARKRALTRCKKRKGAKRSACVRKVRRIYGR